MESGALVRAAASLALLPLLLTALAAAGHAQEDPRPFQFRTFLRVQGEYDDNFFRSERDKQDEFREIVTPGISLRFTTGPSHAQLSYSPSLIHSSLNEGEVQLSHLLGAEGSLRLTERLTLRATESFLRSDDPTLTDPRGTRRDRTVLIQNTLGLELPYKRDTWSLTPRYGLTFNENQRDAAGSIQDRQTDTGTTEDERSVIHTWGVDGTLSILGRNTLGAGYDYTLGDFRVGDDFVGHFGRISFTRELNPLTTAGVTGSIAHRIPKEGNAFNILRGNISLRREVSRLYSIETRAGYGFFQVEGGDSSGEFEYSLTGTYSGKFVRFTTTSGQSFQETFLERENVGVTKTRETAAELRYEPTPDLAVTLRGRLAENRFLQQTTGTTATVAAGTGEERKDVQLEGTAEVVFRLSRLFSLTLGYTYITVDSNQRGLDYAANRVRVGLTATYE